MTPDPLADEQFDLAAEFFALQFARRIVRIYCAYGVPESLHTFLRNDGYAPEASSTHWSLTRPGFPPPSNAAALQRLGTFIAAGTYNARTQSRFNGLLARLTLGDL